MLFIFCPINFTDPCVGDLFASYSMEGPAVVDLLVKVFGNSLSYSFEPDPTDSSS